MGVPAFNPSTSGAETGGYLSSLKASLVYRVRSRTEETLALKKKKKKG